MAEEKEEIAVKQRQVGPIVTQPKYTQWRRPIRKKTAAELLEKADAGQAKLTASQRETLEARAGKSYKKKDPLVKRPDESTQEYLARIQKMFAKGDGQ